MSELPPPTSPPARPPTSRHDSGTNPDTAASRQQYVAYRPPNQEYTPPASPASPQLHNNPHAHSAARKGFGAGRSRQPARLQMDIVAAAPAYERPVYSPSPTASPTLPPLASPKFSARSRTPSLLRHAALSSPLQNVFPPTDLPQSPTMAPMMRQVSNHSVTSDPRTIFNPLASNPVGQMGPSWDPFTDDVAGNMAQQRLRGMTTSAQASFQPYPPLRAATSIPDYGQIRTGDRFNRSGAYKPDRGVPNWAHADHYPPRPFRGEESRASVRSGWTMGSSFMEASGTERSSIATGRSSVSDNRASTYSRDRSEERDLSTDTLPTSVSPDEEDLMNTVEDVIDAYFDDMEEETLDSSQADDTVDRRSSAQASDDRNEHSSTYSQDFSTANSPPSSSHGETNKPKSLHGRGLSTHTVRTPVEDGRNPEPDSQVEKLPVRESFGRDSTRQYNEPEHSSPRQLEQTVTNVSLDPPVEAFDAAMQRLSEDIPRRTSTMHSGRRSRILSQRPRLSSKMSTDNRKMQEIHKELAGLPEIPRSRAQLSQQDQAQFQGYAQRHARGPSAALRALTGDLPPPSQDPASPTTRTSPLPEVDEDEAFPRRASTSVYDRKSTLFELNKFEATLSSKAMTSNFGDNKLHAKPSVMLKKSAAVGVERDRYGFKKVSDKISLQDYNSWFGKYDDYVSRRRDKWVAFMGKQGLPTTTPTRFPQPSDKTRRYVRKGYPPEWRGEMWWFYSGAQMKSKQMSGLYRSLVARVNNGELNKDDREAIERDLDRTFPDNIHFRPDPKSARFSDGTDDEPSLIKDLREVLSAFALNNPNIGYCQSLNFIAGLLLLFLKQDTERSFILLTVITQMHLPGAHARNLANTEVNVLMMLIKDYLPRVWASINDADIVNSGPGSKAHPESKFQRQPTVALSCTSWFMSVFIGVLPIETVLRVWDAFLYEGPRALYRYALAIFKLGENEIRKYRPGDGELFMAVQNLPRRCLDANALHDIAFVKKGFGSLTQNVIDQKRQYWREQNDRTKRSASQKSRTQAFPGPPHTAGADAVDKKVLGGLRRRASKRFLKKR